MKIEINTDTKYLYINNERIDLYSMEAFKIISDLWVKIGWDQKHLYGFTWLGRPIIQLPDDMLRIQEVIYSLKPDVIIETGVAHGGSLIFYASLCKAMSHGRIIGVDIEIRSHNRSAIESHELFEFITLIEGSSIEESTLVQVRKSIKAYECVLVILDSCHSYDHVLRELKLYSQFIGKDSYIVATDGIQGQVGSTPRAIREYPDCTNWIQDNPQKAAEDFVKQNRDFEIVEPDFLFNEGNIDFRITHWPCAFIKKIK